MLVALVIRVNTVFVALAIFLSVVLYRGSSRRAA